MPFSEKTLDFLFENRVVDSKSWFTEHRADYDALVLTPLRELVTALAPAMLEIDPLLCCEPKVGKCISRIYRDTRFTHDKHLFRDVMWCSFFQRKQLYYGLPGFFFEFSPRGMRWGCGYYQASPDSMAAIRRLVLAGDKDFLAAERTLKKHRLALEDSRYKRTRHPDAAPAQQLWLDQRSICVLTDSEDFDLLYSDALADTLAGHFRDMAPLYRFLMKAESQVPKTRGGAQ